MESPTRIPVRVAGSGLTDTPRNGNSPRGAGVQPAGLTISEAGTLLDLVKGDLLARLAQVEGPPEPALDALIAEVDALIELRAVELRLPALGERREELLLGAFRAIRRRSDEARTALLQACRMALYRLTGEGDASLAAQTEDLAARLRLAIAYAEHTEAHG